MAITPRNDDLLAGVAGQRSQTFDPAQSLLVTGDVPAQMSYPYPVAANLNLAARTVVAFDGAGNVIVAEFGSVAGVKATGTLTFSGVGTAAETITVGTRVYTMVATLTGVADQVLIGASATASAQNFKNAINADAATLGVTHGSTTDHPSVLASGAAAAILLTANAAGVAGNSVATTETLATAAAFGAATLTGGANAVATAPAAIGFVKYAADNSAGGDGAIKVEVTRMGCFNPDALTWDASYDTLAKKLYAFEGAPSPTAIIIRQPTAMTVA
jgi:hypothetical protein